jgi:hypothetical protein
MKLEFVDPIPELVKDYENVVKAAIMMGLITEKEWNTRFKFYRDKAGYSFVHYLSCIMSIEKINTFCTENPIMLDNRDELQKRFKVTIVTLKELMEIEKNG